LQALKSEPPEWPESTRWLSQLRLTIEFRPQGLLDRLTGRNRLHVDIVDYPGEWLLDLPLLQLTYAEWSQRAVRHAQDMKRSLPEAARWLAFMKKIVPDEAAVEARVIEAAKLFKAYLHAARDDERTLSAQPPGRFLMPGDLEGAPALTFCPLLLAADGRAVRGSYREMMERRFESYKAQVVKPFFRDHFARLDRQIVLVDALAAVNGGRTALDELKQAMTEILRAFRPGANSWLSSLLYRRIDRILFAATKADHLHHTSHDRLEAILSQLMAEAIERAEFAGAQTSAIALAAIRATHEATATHDGEVLPCIVGVPAAGEHLGRRIFDGKEEFAIFPGDLPESLDAAARGDAESGGSGKAFDTRFIRFLPPRLNTAQGAPAAPPHIRLDKAMNFLFGDKLA
ncbi:MAG: YcjX family protein, partial [Alphaproteobacteria bacterium]